MQWQIMLLEINVRENRMDNPKLLATLGKCLRTKTNKPTKTKQTKIKKTITIKETKNKAKQKHAKSTRHC